MYPVSMIMGICFRLPWVTLNLKRNIYSFQVVTLILHFRLVIIILLNTCGCLMLGMQ